MKRYFITGTDTDCGKTYVSCQLVDYLKSQEKQVIAVKPVASGCIKKEGQLMSEDALLLEQHQGDMAIEICPWRFKNPISPHLAAEESGDVLSIKAITAYCLDDVFAGFDYQLIEGAGGLMAPLNSSETWLDFLSYSQIPVILVVGMRLGCLNHALLSELALNSKGIQCAGWIANCLDHKMLALTENINTLIAKLSSPLLATIDYKGKLNETIHQI